MNSQSAGGGQGLEIRCERHGHAGVVRLNRPQALNALTADMVDRLSEALLAWGSDPTIAHVVVAAEGRAFCAGGDIRRLAAQIAAGGQADALRFWAREYSLNRQIRRFPKPYISLIDGLVMGGGVGISVHGSVRVASERYAFAMPEVGIGFFPDVGATYVLPRCPGLTGTYLALCGARASCGDALALGLATHYVPSGRFAELAERLTQADWRTALAATATAGPDSAIAASRAEIDRIFDADGLDAIEANLRGAAGAGSAFAAAALALLTTKSPTSLAIALRQMRLGATLTFDEALTLEYRIVSRLCANHDFAEGVRALIIDKDQAPQWLPNSIGALDDQAIATYFAPLGLDELAFPENSGYGASR
jgi:enoyl-CoA hydratase